MRLELHKRLLFERPKFLFVPVAFNDHPTDTLPYPCHVLRPLAQRDSRGRDGDRVAQVKAARQRKGLAENFHVESSGSNSEEEDGSEALEPASSDVSDHASLPKTQAAKQKKSRKNDSPVSPSRASAKFAVEDASITSEDSNAMDVSIDADMEAEYWARKARGEFDDFAGSEEGEEFSGDEFSSDSEYEEVDEANEEYNKGVFQQEMAFGDETHRIAVVNCDWDHLRAIDILVVCSSFCPSTGLVKSVHIYPSDFGLSMMAEEDVNGPAIYKDSDDEEEGESSDDGKPASKARKEERKQTLDEIKLRRYELNKLRYYFAVVTCDSAETAAALYGALDNQEIEMTSNKLDMRFVPDDVSFEGRKIHSEAHEIPLDYQPPHFETNVLQKTETKLTWDQTPKERLSVTQAAFSHLVDIDEAKYAQYIASSESESEEEDENSDESEENGESGVLMPKNDEDGDAANIKKSRRKKYASLLLGLDGLDDEDGDNDEKEKNEMNDFFTSATSSKKKKGKEAEGEMTFTLNTDSSKPKSGKKASLNDDEIKRKVQEKLEAKPSKSFKPNSHRAVVPKYRPDEKHSEDEESENENSSENSNSGSGSESDDMPSLIPASKKQGDKKREGKNASSSKDKSQDKKSKFDKTKKKSAEKTKGKKSVEDDSDDNRDMGSGSDDEGEQKEGSSKKDIWDGFEDAFAKPSKSQLSKLKKRKREEREKERKSDKQTRAELSLLVGKKDGFESSSEADDSSDNSENGGRGKSSRSKKAHKKAKKGEAPQSDINLKDSRFAALMQDPRFLPDPTNPNFKKTASVKAILDARKEYRKETGLEEDVEEEAPVVSKGKGSSSHAATSSYKTSSSASGHKKTVQKGFYDLGKKQDDENEQADLDDLVASIKRKSASHAARK